VSEEAISKGIRRIVALTGPEALKAENKCNALEERVENIQNLVQQKMKEGGLKIKETSQEISRIGEVCFFFLRYDIQTPSTLRWGKFEASLTSRLGLPSTLMRQKNAAFRKRLIRSSGLAFYCERKTL